MAWNPYGLDQIAHRLVQRALEIDADSTISGDSCLREVYEMRESVAYGLERFWGEQLRHQNKEQHKNATYWQETWEKLVATLGEAGVLLPNDADVGTMAQKLWGDIPLNDTGVKLTHENRQLALAVLAQLCDCMVWWTQRYKQ
ncbi:MAG: hypothetical protein ACKO24_04485 [Leptolyngbyaceae cyanobacterium]